MTGNQKIRVLLIDDHSWIHESVTNLIDQVDDIQLIGQGSTGTQAVRLYAEHPPDVVLMDIIMPEMGGVDATRQIIERDPQAKVLALSSFQDEKSVYDMLRSGAIGYVLKGALIEELIPTIRAVHHGSTVLSPQIAKILMEAPDTKEPAIDFGLTRRELDVLREVCEGSTNAQVAQKLHISSATVKFHLQNIIEKMGVETRTEAIVLAAKNNLI